MGRGKVTDISGQTFAHLTVLERAAREPDAKNRQVKWVCQCRCGEVLTVAGHNLRSGRSTSCGKCHTSKISPARGVYSLWNNIKQRCQNTNNELYPLYGGSGVTMAPEWEDFFTFKHWLEEQGFRHGMSLVLISGSTTYAPGQCKLESAEKTLKGRSKLTASEVQDIRTRNKAGELVSDLAREYKVSYEAVRLIVIGRRWKKKI